MRNADVVNGAAILAVVALGTLGALQAGPTARGSAAVAPDDVEPGRGTAVIEDATGFLAEPVPTGRVASGCTISDQVLLEILEPERLVAVTERSRSGPNGWRYPPGGSIRTGAGVEELLSLRPDLVFVCSSGGAIDHITRAREAGLQVFDLGAMLGLASLPDQVLAIAAMVGQEQRGEVLLGRFLGRLARVAADIPLDSRPTGLYLSIYGERCYGGGAGSSYHDLLTSAGVVDLAAERGFTGWPAYDVETLLALDPALVITRDGGRDSLCRHLHFGRIRACGPSGRVIELDEHLIGDPGLGLLPAAEALRRAVHGPAPLPIRPTPTRR